MKSRSYGRLLSIVIGIFTLVTIVFTVFSRAQQGTVSSVVQDPASAVTEEQIAALAEARKQAFFNNRVPHPACPNCFKVGDGRYGIYEEVPGTGMVLSRDLPDPAPLQAGEVRPEKDDETGEPIWYIGTQGFVGSTDEEPLSDSLPIPKVELKRIQARHQVEIFGIKGVHSLGIGEKGFRVSILPEGSKNQDLIPTSIEGIPVQVDISGIAEKMSHQSQWYRPVPVGVGIVTLSTNGGGAGTLGPHAVRDIQDIPTCCTIWSLTAGHVIQATYQPPGFAIGAPVNQGGQNWGSVAWVFQEQRCDPNCSASSPLNDTRWHPDTGAIVQPEPTPYPMTPPCYGSSKPVRRMQYTTSQYVHGPTGVIRIPNFSSCPSGSNCLKAWGAYSDAPKGDLYDVNLYLITSGNFAIGDMYYEGPLDRVTLERALQPGDSGSLVAWNGSDNRQVAGLLLDRVSDKQWIGDYIRADYIKTAFYNAGISFNHYWGTDPTALRPSSSQYDNPC